jgi:hypothetical protein
MLEDDIYALLTFDDLTEEFASEYFVELEMLLQFVDAVYPYDETAAEPFAGFVRLNNEAWEMVLLTEDTYVLLILGLDNLALAYENEYPVELEVSLNVVDEWHVFRFEPVVIEDQPVTLPFVIPAPQPVTTPVVPAAPQPVPVPVAEIAPAPTTSAYHSVWLSATGTRWHSINNCGRMDPTRARRVSLDYARSRSGFGPCATCNPPR